MARRYLLKQADEPRSEENPEPKEILLGKYKTYLHPRVGPSFHIYYAPVTRSYRVATQSRSSSLQLNIKKFIDTEIHLHKLWLEYKCHPQSIVVDYLSSFFITRDANGRIWLSFLVEDYYKEVFVKDDIDDNIVIN